MVDTKEIFKTEKRITWADRLESLKIGESFPAEFRSRTGITTAIWIKSKSWNRQFETNVTGSIVTVTRKEDDFVTNIA